jgi:hypothetical protein
MKGEDMRPIEGEKQHPAAPTSGDNHPLPEAEEVRQPLDEDQVSGTDIVGDETNVRTRDGVDKPGIVEGIPPKPE